MGQPLFTVADSPCFNSSEIGEALVVRAVLYFATSRGFTDILLETDSLVVVNYVNGIAVCKDIYLHTLVQDISLYISSNGKMSVGFLSRQANCVAYALAQAALSHPGLEVWEGSSPWL
ncbi:hypothetical protein NE237_029521 [Protea cynaroides]|uniref:RNase H type-1 domain-containing protein n=1 Tax=Protea cynaroides TaxID=273540 RepID=A0A9Q0GVZ2_9MAGN|nr:hypothetical protein NE237_029521 [Protea cynaroides]